LSGPWREPAAGGPVHELDAETILRVLREHDVDFVVIGGLAVAAHGFVRATKDVDIVPRGERENRRRLYEALASLQAFPLEIGDFRPEEMPVPFTADGLDEGGNWALLTSAGRVAVLQWVAGVDSYEDLCARALAVDVDRVGRVLFAGYDDVLTMKRAAGRPQDQSDIAELERLSG
jgi:hypothetical protein